MAGESSVPEGAVEEDVDPRDGYQEPGDDVESKDAEGGDFEAARGFEEVADYGNQEAHDRDCDKQARDTEQGVVEVDVGIVVEDAGDAQIAHDVDRCQQDEGADGRCAYRVVGVSGHDI